MTDDTEAAPHAAEGMSAEQIEQALNVLRAAWGGEYMFGFDQEHDCWWVIRSGNLGSLLTAPTAQELGNKLGDGELGAADASRRP
jgi:hypothetical protein